MFRRTVPNEIRMKEKKTLDEGIFIIIFIIFYSYTPKKIGKNEYWAHSVYTHCGMGSDINFFSALMWINYETQHNGVSTLDGWRWIETIAY